MAEYAVEVITRWTMYVEAESKDEAIDKVAAFGEPGPDNITDEDFYAELTEED
jgi:hypothetical protein